MPSRKDIQAMSEYRGIFGMGISTNYYLDLLNGLWKEASVEMLRNAEKAGMYTPDKS